ncbi:hypothetical protein [Microlunatus elymi]|nr:hypothetical protein [Microlunatus elymi]
MHCPAPRIDPGSAAGRQWISEQHLPEGYATVAMTELPTDAVVRAWATSYGWAHRPLGGVHADRLPHVWTDYSRGVDPDMSMLTLDRSGEIVAFSLVSPDVWDGRTMIISETVEFDQPDGTGLQKATVAASLAVLAQNKLHPVDLHRIEFEGHSTDPHTPALFDSLPDAGADPMDIVELAPPL